MALPSTFFIIPRKRRSRIDRNGGPLTAGRALRSGGDRRSDSGTRIPRVVKSASWHRCLVVIRRKAAPSGRRFESYGRIRRSGSECIGSISTKSRPPCLRRPASPTTRLVGYNETIGYRAGTTQVFRPSKSDRLLELPMHVMDTALFYPSNMDLKPSQAKVILDQMIANCVRFGGVLTVNWHDRSLAPDRLWDQPIVELLEELRGKRAWFATTAQAVAWFRKRRSARFD